MEARSDVSSNELKWIESEGGPFIVLASSQVSAWTGVEGGDYDATCDISDYLGLVTLSDGSGTMGLVVADEPLPSTFLPDLQCIVQWTAAPSDADLLRAAREAAVSLEDWHAGPVFSVTESLLMFDATIPGAALTEEESLAVSLPEGKHQFRTADFAVGDDVAGRLHTITPIG